MKHLQNCSAQSELKKFDESRNAEKRRNTPDERRRGREGNQEYVTGNQAAPSTGIPSPKPEGTYDLGHAIAEVQEELVVADSDKKIACQSTRPPQRARSHRGGVKAPPGADPWPPEPPQSCCTLGNDTLKPPCNTWWREVKKDSPTSSLVSSQGVSSPTLPNGCGRELTGLSLHRDQGKVSDVCCQRRQRGGADIAISPPLLDGS